MVLYRRHSFTEGNLDMYWHCVYDDDYPQERTYCLCKTDNGWIKRMFYSHGGWFVSANDYHYDKNCKKFSFDDTEDIVVVWWCSLDDILEAIELGLGEQT